jgi:predicted metal-dependent peptidase
MRFNTIKDILAHKFVGNHAADYEAFIAIKRFARDAHKDGRLDEMIKAVHHIEVSGMGMQGSALDEIVDAFKSESW